MRFTCSIEIDMPLKKVVQLFDDPSKTKLWQPNFTRREHLDGAAGRVGARSRLVYGSGKNAMELIETIKVKNLPERMMALYEHKQMTNTMDNSFVAVAPGKTKWEVVIDYTKLNGIATRLMAALMPGMFKKQTQQWMERFKQFAEQA